LLHLLYLFKCGRAALKGGVLLPAPHHPDQQSGHEYLSVAVIVFMLPREVRICSSTCGQRTAVQRELAKSSTLCRARLEEKFHG
jgi:hypothetical protein